MLVALVFWMKNPKTTITDQSRDLSCSFLKSFRPISSMILLWKFQFQWLTIKFHYSVWTFLSSSNCINLWISIYSSSCYLRNLTPVFKTDNKYCCWTFKLLHQKKKLKFKTFSQLYHLTCTYVLKFHFVIQKFFGINTAIEGLYVFFRYVTK